VGGLPVLSVGIMEESTPAVLDGSDCGNLSRDSGTYTMHMTSGRRVQGELVSLGQGSIKPLEESDWALVDMFAWVERLGGKSTDEERRDCRDKFQIFGLIAQAKLHAETLGKKHWS